MILKYNQLKSEYKQCIARRKERFCKFLLMKASHSFIKKEIKLMSHSFIKWLFYRIINNIIFKIKDKRNHLI